MTAPNGKRFQYVKCIAGSDGCYCFGDYQDAACVAWPGIYATHKPLLNVRCSRVTGVDRDFSRATITSSPKAGPFQNLTSGTQSFNLKP